MKFRFKHSVFIIIALSLVIVLSLVSAVFNVVRLIEVKNLNFFNSADKFVMLIVSLLLAGFGVGLLFFSFYKVCDKNVILRFGILKTVINVSNVKSFVYFNAQKKLVMYLKNDEYTVIVLKQDKYRSFVEKVMEENPSVTYAEQFEDKN